MNMVVASHRNSKQRSANSRCDSNRPIARIVMEIRRIVIKLSKMQITVHMTTMIATVKAVIANSNKKGQ